MKKILGISNFVKNNLKEINNQLLFPLQSVSLPNEKTKYRFVGINERINLSVSKTEAEIWYLFHKLSKDWLFDLSITAEKNKAGKFICSECKTPEFPTESELYQSHFVKDLYKIQKNQFKRKFYLIYCSLGKGGFFFTKIMKDKELIFFLKDKKKKGLEIISIEKIVV